jgi:hypothetical protein
MIDVKPTTTAWKLEECGPTPPLSSSLSSSTSTTTEKEGLEIQGAIKGFLGDKYESLLHAVCVFFLWRSIFL